MTLLLTVDGSHHSGNYRVDCLCGTTWSGQGEAMPRWGYSPALPVAECVAHMKLAHPDLSMDLRFTSRFEVWLTNHWRRVARTDRIRTPATGGRLESSRGR